MLDGNRTKPHTLRRVLVHTARFRSLHAIIFRSASLLPSRAEPERGLLKISVFTGVLFSLGMLKYCVRNTVFKGAGALHK